ncbi:hypothetical protein [Paenibacillus amylolyticus]|uniref:hypothetical protein n=1 Tax=Paenibacillus amylolyticus TaxID=1451 RepID=UPI0037CCA89E
MNFTNSSCANNTHSHLVLAHPATSLYAYPVSHDLLRLHCDQPITRCLPTSRDHLFARVKLDAI